MKKILISLVLLLSVFGCIGQDTGDTVPSSPEAGTGLTGNAVQTPPDAGSDAVRISLSEIDSTVRYFKYDSGGVEVRYFAVKGSDGIVRTAFDACKVCYKAGKGYTQVGSDVKCNNCNLQFRIDDLGSKNQGKGCWPAYLPNKAEGDSIVIQKSDLEAGSYLFS